MAIYTSSITGWTTAAIAEGGALTANNFHGLQTIAADYCRITEFDVHGDGTTSIDLQMAVRRSNTLSTTVTTRTPRALNPMAINAASFKDFVAVGGALGTTATVAQAQHIASPSINAQNGIFRWVPVPNEEAWIFATAVLNSEVTLSAVAGVSTVSTTFFVEEM